MQPTTSWAIFLCVIDVLTFTLVEMKVKYWRLKHCPGQGSPLEGNQVMGLAVTAAICLFNAPLKR